MPWQMEGNRSSIFDVAMLQNYCVRPNLDGSISTISNVAIPLILHVGSPHSYNQWQCYIPETVDFMLFISSCRTPIYAQISHTFVTSECILYMYNYVYIYIYIYYIIIYIYSSLVESFCGWTYMPKFWLKNHGQDVIFVSFSFGQASRCRRHNGGLSGWCRMASAE